ncbi:MAG TPA: chromosomal replication initiator protein DnaA [Acidobacteriota bacterium]|nr:chromosomal replication initiator protein DnaA [Acidobacteriota bacterium]
MQLWDRILSKIESRISSQNFELWFAPTAVDHEDLTGRKLYVRVPNKHFKYWLAENYSSVLEAALAELEMQDFHVQFLAPDEEAGPPDRSRSGRDSSREEPNPPASAYLNTKYTFESFVVGFSNQFAHAAALAVAEQPSRAYNPLFIYGGVGLGKTHLMHAIGHRISRNLSHLRLTYMPSERFMNELIHSIRYDKMIGFREKYRNIDVLLIDDIQFLAGKERTQEEFFHTFNALYDSQKQIIISSDSPPKEIPTLEERLHSRFEWGLIADIQPPDLETKIAILRKKAEAQHVELDDEVCLFIAGNIKSNIRELEGALVRLAAFSSLTGERIDLALAQRVLKNITENQARVITIDGIQKEVAQHYSINVSDLKAKSNSRRITEPRQVAMYLSKELTDASLSEIGKQFGGKHHTTVLHAIRKVEKLRESDPKMRIALEKLSTGLQQ